VCIDLEDQDHFKAGNDAGWNSSLSHGHTSLCLMLGLPRNSMCELWVVGGAFGFYQALALTTAVLLLGSELELELLF
jgi:hypothetical protein